MRSTAPLPARSSDCFPALQTIRGDFDGKHRIRIVGRVSDPLPYYRAADVHVLHAFGESLPFCVMESMAMGLPNLVTNNFGIPEMVDHEVSGLLYDYSESNMQDFSSGLQRLYNSAELRETLGDAARQQAHQKFSLPLMQQKYDKLWTEVLARHI